MSFTQGTLEKKGGSDSLNVAANRTPPQIYASERYTRRLSCHRTQTRHQTTRSLRTICDQECAKTTKETRQRSRLVAAPRET